LQGSECCYRYGRRLLEREVGWFQHQCLFGLTHIFGEGAGAPAEDLLTWLKLRHVSANRFNLPGQINSQACDLWFAQPGL